MLVYSAVPGSEFCFAGILFFRSLLAVIYRNCVVVVVLHNVIEMLGSRNRVPFPLPDTKVHALVLSREMIGFVLRPTTSSCANSYHI